MAVAESNGVKTPRPCYNAKMGVGNSNSNRPRTRKGWFALALLAVIIGIEFAFPNGSTAQMCALAVAVVFFGSIIAWRTFR